MLNTFDYNITDLSINMRDIAIGMAYEGNEPEEPYISIAHEMIEKIKSECDIRGGYVVHEKVQFNKEDLTLETEVGRFNVGKIVFHQMKKSEQIAFFACTAGKGIDVLSRKMMNQGDIIEGYMIDIIGTIIVEKAMDRVQQVLQEQMKDNQLKITNRYSPGYCNWDVAEQHKLFSMFPQDFCGISLTDSALMNPVKSVSGIIGIGKDVNYNPYTCNFCDRTSCIYRNKKVKSRA
ncbi:MAG: hypothetical protein GVY19_08815 [Bacteroidetes bacterium]|jgi:hypothetical protein|nr:hypothetical protein [Bacteroidota bacterium]